MWRSRTVYVCVVILAAVLAFPEGAGAQSTCDDPRDRNCSATGVVGDDNVIIAARDGVRPGRGDGDPPPTRTSAVPVCEYGQVPADFERERVLHNDRLAPPNAVFFTRDCGDGSVLDWYVPRESDPTAQPMLRALVDEAMKVIEPPVPLLVTSPPLGSEVVTGLPMYLAVEDRAFEVLTGEVSAGQFSVSAEVVPVSTWFSPGDEHGPVVCEGAGSVWSAGQRPGAGECTHTFTHVPADLGREGEGFEVRSRVRYRASYRVSGPVLAGSYELGEFDGPEGSVLVPVIERRAVRVNR